MALTFIKDAPLLRLNVISVVGTFVVGEFFIDDNNPLKIGEVIALAIDEYGSISSIDYILVGSNAVQFADTDTFSSQCTTGGTGGTGIIDGTPTVIGFHHVHVIQVDLPATQVTIQELVNEIRDYEDELIHEDHLSLANATGKQDLGGGVAVGITLELLDEWRVQFESRTGPVTVQVSVTGGNIVTTNSFSNNPIKASPYTQVQVTSASSATIAELQIIDLVHRIESLRESHGRFGSIIYWDPIGGNDAFPGDSPGRATLTFAAAQTLAAADVGDVIQCLTKSATADTVEVDEQLTITKNALSVRGPGENFVFKHGSTAGAGPTITVEANNIELSGFLITHDFAGATDGIHIDGAAAVGGVANNCRVVDVTIRDINNHAILMNDSGDSELVNLFIEDPGADGIRIGNNVDDLRINKSIIDRATGQGVNLFGTSILDTIFENNQIHDCGQYGVRIGAGTNQTIIRVSTFFFDNTLGDILEVAGSQNVTIEQEILDKPINDVRVSVESLRPHHISSGTTFYWDPISGNDANAGRIPSKPVKTFAQAHSLVADNNHDTIFCLAHAANETITTETITISKNRLYVRGPGRDFVFKPTADEYGIGAGINTVTITGSGVEITGVRFENRDTTALHSIFINGGDHTHIQHCWFDGSAKMGIRIHNSANTEVNNNHIEDFTLYGIHLTGSNDKIEIKNNTIINCDEHGIFLDVTLATDVLVDGNAILNCDISGITINSSSIRTSIRGNNFLGNNILGNIVDNGVDTVIELSGEEIWDALIANHTIVNSYGKKLTDILKLKRTKP